MIKRFKLSCAAVVFCLLVSVSYGARTVQFMYFNQPADAPKEVYMYRSEEATIQVDLPQYNFTACYDIPAGEQMLRFSPQLYLPDEEIPENIPSVRIPKNWKKVFILAFYDPDNEAVPLKFRAINASPEHFSNGNTLFINFSSKTIFGMLGDDKILVGPSKMEIAKLSLSPNEEYFVDLRYTDEKCTENYRFLKKIFRHYADQRKIVFVYVPEASKGVKYFVVTVREYYTEASKG